MNKNDLIKLLKSCDVDDFNENKLNNERKYHIVPQIDFEYHCIRRAIYLQYAMASIINVSTKSNYNKSQLKTILKNLSKLEVKKATPKKFYTIINSIEEKEKLKHIPLCNLSHKSKFKTYFTKIKKTMETILKKIKNDEKEAYYNTILKLEPYEAIILWYMIELYQYHKYCQTSPTTIYNITHEFEKTGSKIKNLFNETEASRVKNIVDKAMNDIHKDNNKVEWNIEHMIIYGGNTDWLKLTYRNIPIIGNSDNTVYHIVFITDYNKLNHWDTLIKIMIERFMIFNPSDKGEDIRKFKDKSIKTYLFILKQQRYELFDFLIDTTDQVRSKLIDLVVDSVMKYFSSINNELYNYQDYIANKDESKKWKKKGFRTPYKYISNEYSGTEHICDSFKLLDEKCKSMGKKAAKEISEDKTRFNQLVNEKIKDMCNDYFRLNNTERDSDEEW